MSLTVEDGTGRPNADSYVSVDDATAYHAARGNTGWATAGSSDGGQSPASFAAQEAALRRATTFIDATYRGRFPGYPLKGRAQALEWPRSGAYVVVPDNGRSEGLLYHGNREYAFVDGIYQIPTNQVPREINAAVCEAALRELVKPGSLAPDLKRGGAIKSAGAGSARVEFFGGAPATTTFQAIDLALAALLMPARSFNGRAARG